MDPHAFPRLGSGALTMWLTVWLTRTARGALDAWLRPVDPLPLGAYRSLFGLLSLANGILLAPDLDAWFGDAGLVAADLAGRGTDAWRINVLAWTGSSPAAVRALFAVFMAAAALTTVGLWTRTATVVLFVATASFHHRNPYILSSGDTMMRLMAFFLALAPAGAAFSVDRLLRVRSGREPSGETPPIPPTAFRVMQLQVCLAYLVTGIWKTCGETWRDGTAVFLVLQLGQFSRFPLPAWAHTLWFSRIATWYALAVELLAPLFVWFRSTRRTALAALVVLHLSLEYALNIQLFQPIMLAGLVLFLDPAELRRVLRASRRQKLSSSPRPCSRGQRRSTRSSRRDPSTAACPG